MDFDVCSDMLHYTDLSKDLGHHDDLWSVFYMLVARTFYWPASMEENLREGRGWKI